MYAQDIWGFQTITVTEDQLILKNLFRRKENVIWLDEIDKGDISEIIFGDENGVLGRYPRVEICYEKKKSVQIIWYDEQERVGTFLKAIKTNGELNEK